MTARSKFEAKRSFHARHVKLCGAVNPYDHSCSVRLTFAIDMNADDARALASALIAEAEKSDARYQAEVDKRDRRAKWRDREVKAGRMVNMTLGDLLRRPS